MNVNYLKYGGNLFLQDIDFVRIQNYTFTSSNSTQGGGIFLQNCNDVFIYKCYFQKNLVTQSTGGAISIQDSNKIVIIYNKFYNNTAMDGGAIAMQGKIGFFDIELNEFIHNQAELYGGAIVFKQFQLVNKLQIDKSRIQNNKFESQKSKFGGALAFVGLQEDINRSPFLQKQYLLIQENEFLVNFAKYQGGCFYFQINNQDYQQINNNPFQIEKNTIRYNIAPSGQIAKFNGYFNNKNILIDISDDIFNKNYIKQYSENLGTLISKDCQFGEYQDQNNKDFCIPCPKGLYNFEENNETCNQCPKNAKCPGGYSGIVGDAGFWKWDQYSTFVNECPNKDACKPITENQIQQQLVMYNEFDPDIQCAGGYSGPLCQVCSIEHKKVGQIICSKCNNIFKIILYFVFQNILIFLFIYLLAYSNYSKINKEFLKKYTFLVFNKSVNVTHELSPYTNIALSYFQYIYIIFQIMPQVGRIDFIFQNFSFLAQYSNHMLCIFPQIFYDNDLASELLYEIFFLILITCILIVFSQKVFKSKIQYKSIIIAAIKIKSPVFMTKSYELLTFRIIDGHYLVSGDYSITWGSNKFIKENLPLGTIIWLIFVIIVPLKYYFIMRQYKTKIKGKFHYDNLLKLNKKLKMKKNKIVKCKLSYDYERSDSNVSSLQKYENMKQNIKIETDMHISEDISKKSQNNKNLDKDQTNIEQNIIKQELQIFEKQNQIDSKILDKYEKLIIKEASKNSNLNLIQKNSQDQLQTNDNNFSDTDDEEEKQLTQQSNQTFGDQNRQTPNCKQLSIYKQQENLNNLEYILENDQEKIQAFNNLTKEQIKYLKLIVPDKKYRKFKQQYGIIRGQGSIFWEIKKYMFQVFLISISYIFQNWYTLLSNFFNICIFLYIVFGVYYPPYSNRKLNKLFIESISIILATLISGSILIFYQQEQQTKNNNNNQEKNQSKLYIIILSFILILNIYFTIKIIYFIVKESLKYYFKLEYLIIKYPKLKCLQCCIKKNYSLKKYLNLKNWNFLIAKTYYYLQTKNDLNNLNEILKQQEKEQKKSISKLLKQKYQKIQMFQNLNSNQNKNLRSQSDNVVSQQLTEINCDMEMQQNLLKNKN